MYHYPIFGGHLSSELDFPELPSVITASSDWVFRIASPLRPGEAAAPAEALLVGEDSIEGVAVRLFSHEGGFQLIFDDSGRFDISADGATITWYPEPDVDLGLVRADVLARVLVVSLHIAGKLCLHGSAVAVPGGSLAFLAPKRHGKSTLALALIQAGLGLVTDDTLAVDTSTTLAAPGVHSVRLWNDAADALGAGQIGGELGQWGQKQVLTRLPEEMLVRRPVPLSAVYMLRPVHELENGQAADRLRLPPIQAALGVLQHARLGSLLGGVEAAAVFERAAALAQGVPVYALSIVRAWERLPEVVDRLAEWHGFDSTLSTKSLEHA